MHIFSSMVAGGRRRKTHIRPEFGLPRNAVWKVSAVCYAGSMVGRPLLKALLFLALAALAVIGYLFLLNVLNGKAGSFSTAIPAIFLALATLALNWRFLEAEGSSLAEAGFDRPRLRFRQASVG